MYSPINLVFRLTTERDEVLAEVRRIEQAVRAQELANRDLQIRELTSKAQIKGLSQQLGKHLQKTTFSYSQNRGNSK